MKASYLNYWNYPRYFELIELIERIDIIHVYALLLPWFLPFGQSIKHG